MRKSVFKGLFCVIIMWAMLLSSFEIAAVGNSPADIDTISDIGAVDVEHAAPEIPMKPENSQEKSDLMGLLRESTYQGEGASPMHYRYSEAEESPLPPNNGIVAEPENVILPYWKIEPELLIKSKSVDGLKVIITATDMNEVRALLGLEKPQNSAFERENENLRLKTTILEIQSSMLLKIASLESVMSIQSYKLPEPPQFPGDIEGETEFDSGSEPTMWNAVKYHGADKAWSLGFNGSGVKVAVLDTGVDFGHPDLNGTQARDENPLSPYYGWPLAYDSRSMLSYLSSGGQGFPGRDNWYSDTSTTDTDSNSNGTLDASGYNVTGIISQSGIYHVGEHPDTSLWLKYGNYVPVLVVDENLPGIYDTVYVDLNNDTNFTDEKPCRMGDEVSIHDLTGDGIQDRSGGMIYFIADGVNPVPYSDIIAQENGYSLPIPGSGDLVAFMLNDYTEAGGNHGTLCASAVAGQGVIASGRVIGTAPEAKIISVGNVYQGGNFIDSYYFAVEGYDGIPGTGDEAQILSCSFGDSNTINDGWSFVTRLVDNITTNYAPKASFVVAAGNGGYGYGTVTSPGSAAGVITVGAALNERDTEVVYWSNRGPSPLGQLDPDVVSVGVAAYGDQALNQKNDGTTAYQSWSGTSLATPVTAGIVALIYDAHSQSNGAYPSSELTREILMSTADNLNYDALVQGAGFSNATRAVRVANNISGLRLSPSFWSAGSYRGVDYEAFAHIMHPGETDNLTISVSNADQSSAVNVFISDYILSRTETYSAEIDANKSREDPSVNEPDFLIPLNDSKNGISHIPNGTALLKVSAYMPYDEFDPDFDYVQENRFWITIYNWIDSNGNGSYWNDTNSDGVAQPGEIEFSELQSVSSSSATATTQEARMHDPMQRIDDGLLVGIFHQPSAAAPEITHLYVQSQCYDRTDWSWLITNTTALSVNAGGTANFNASLTVPLSTPIGIYEGMIAVNDTRNETVLPVIVNVASNSEKFTFGGNTLSEDLYANDQVFGAFRWGWRYEGGDWRYYFTDIPDSFVVKPGTKIVADVKWDKVPTDIDVFILGGLSDSFSSEMPDRYGPYTLGVNSASVNAYIGAGKFRFNTSTNGPEELLSADLSQGLNEIILHNVLYAGLNFSENATGEIGTVNVTPYPWDIGLIENVADLTGTQQFTVLSSLNLSGITVKAYGVYPPMEYPNQLVYQNDPVDKTTANWSKEFNVSGAKYIKVNTSSQLDIDIDLYLLRDDGNGVPDWGPEEVASSTTPYADEEIILNNPIDGRYWVFVHGWNVPLSPSLFDCYIEVVYGNNITVADVPVGAVVGGKEVYFNASYKLPQKAGEYRGIILLGTNEVPSLISVPFKALLEIEKPLIYGFKPPRDSYVNTTLPVIGAQYQDTGSGINESMVFIYIDGVNQTSNATITSSDINFIPMNPLSEGVHSVFLIVTDNFGNQNSTTWQFTVDLTAPTAVAGFDKAAIEDEVIFFDGSSSSDDNGLVNFTWDFGDNTLGFGVTPSHSYPKSGVYIVTLTVSDLANNTDKDSLTVYVNNLAPDAEAGNDQTVNEGEPAFFDGSGSTDTVSDMSTLIYTWYFNDGSVVSGMTVSHIFRDDGSYDVTLVVEDDNGFTDSDSLNVNVNNVAPTADIGGPYSGEEGNEVQFFGSASDPGEDMLSYYWDFDNDTLYDDAKGQNLSWAWNDNGVYFIGLRVTDDDGGVHEVRTTVNITNIAPTADAGGSYTGDEGSPIALTGMATDPGADTFTYEWDLDNDGSFDDATGNSVVWTWDDNGIYNVGLRVTDDDGDAGKDTATITINNVAPTAYTGGPYSGNESSITAFTGDCTDPGDDIFFYSWDFGDGMISTQQNPTHIYDDDGVYTVTLMVFDDDGSIGKDSTTVIVYNTPPKIEEIGDTLPAKENQIFTLRINATDAVGDMIIFEDDTEMFNIDPISGLIEFTPTNDDVGIKEIVITATDDEGDSATMTLCIDITEEGDQPDQQTGEPDKEPETDWLSLILLILMILLILLFFIHLLVERRSEGEGGEDGQKPVQQEEKKEQKQLPPPPPRLKEEPASSPEPEEEPSAIVPEKEVPPPPPKSKKRLPPPPKAKKRLPPPPLRH